MDIKRCYEILELDPDSSLEEVRQAYRDSVSIWHPDRFGGSNPRLAKRAEEKLKEINEAYETLVLFLSGPGKETPGGACSSKTEAFAEAGTRILLTASSQLMKMFRRWIDADEA